MASRSRHRAIFFRMACVSGPPTLAVVVGRMLGASGGDVAVDARARSSACKIGLAQIAAVGGGLLAVCGRGSLSMPSISADQLAMVARARCQFVRDDDLGLAIDGGLRIVALDVAVLGLQDAALRIGEVALRLRIGLAARRRRRLAGLLAPFRLGASPRPRPGRASLPRAAALASASSAALASRDPGDPLLLVGDPIGQSRRRVCCRAACPPPHRRPRRQPASGRPRPAARPPVASCGHSSSPCAWRHSP